MPGPCRCIVFDAVGTLIHAEPSVSAVYASIARTHGGRRTEAEVRARFARAFPCARPSLRTSESGERQFWRTIVSDVLDDVTDRDACFEALYDHFANPSSWRVATDAGQVLRTLTAAGLRVVIASNFDSRLRTVLDGLPELRPISARVISSEIGWLKPATEFYHAVQVVCGCPLDQILHIGDDLEHDYHAPRREGFCAVHLNPSGASTNGVQTIASLADVPVMACHRDCLPLSRSMPAP